MGDRFAGDPLSTDLPRRRPDRRDYDASAVGYLIMASVSALVVAAFVLGCAPRTPTDERGCYQRYDGAKWMEVCR